MVYYETTEQLMALAKEKGMKTTKDGLLHFNTGKFTGRSPKDRYFVEGEYTDSVIDFNRVINQVCILKLARVNYPTYKQNGFNVIVMEKVYSETSLIRNQV